MHSKNYPLQTRDLFDGNDLFSDFKVFSFARYDPCLSFSTEHWYDIWPAKQMDPLKKKQIVLQVNDFLLLLHVSGNIHLHASFSWFATNPKRFELQRHGSHAGKIFS